jgi:hypothetical protein
MATQTTIIAKSEQELIQELIKNLYMPKKSDFSKVGKGTIYDLPLRSNRNVSFNDYDYTGVEGVVRGLNFPQQLILINRLSERFGTQLSHNSLRKNLDAAYSPEGQKYKDNVLNPYWVYTGEMIQKLPKGYSIHRVNRVDTVMVEPIVHRDHILVYGEPRTLSTKGFVRQYKASPALQTEIPTNLGYFDDFANVIPIDSEIGKGEKGYWNGIYFENNLSAVRCCWGSVDVGLVANADRPLGRGNYGVLGIGIDAPLNK